MALPVISVSPDCGVFLLVKACQSILRGRCKLCHFSVASEEFMTRSGLCGLIHGDNKQAVQIIFYAMCRDAALRIME